MHSLPISDENYPGINPLFLGQRQCDPGFKNGPAVRPYWLLHYVVSGSGRFWIRDKEYTVGAGNMFVIPPYAQSTYQADPEDPWEYIWVGFTYPGTLPVELSDVMECPGALRLFRAMMGCEKYTSGRSAYLCAQIWELFSHLMARAGKKADFIDQALSYMRADYSGKLTTTELANRLNLDRSYFSTQFKKRVGVSPGQYLLDLRMTTAANLLCSGTSVSVTATSVGYADIYIFSKMFKRFYGVSPTQYLKTKT